MPGLVNGTSYTFSVAASSEAGLGEPSDQSGQVVPRSTLFEFQTPVDDSEETTPVELGLRFKSQVPGEVTGVRFYKSAANTGVHTGSLWTTGGELIGQTTFTNETSTGWQTALFVEPVAIEAGKSYIVSYHSPTGRFSFTNFGFSTGVANPPLQAPAAGPIDGNGVSVYSESSAFPDENAFQARNYHVDVLFAGAAQTPPSEPTDVRAAPATNSALVTWNAPDSDGFSPITEYTVMPYIDGEAQGNKAVSVGAAQTSVVVEGLENSVGYTFKVQAANAIGLGPRSDPSPVANRVSRSTSRPHPRYRRPRHELHRARDEVQLRRRRHDSGSPVLQVGRQHGHPHGQPLDRRG